MKLRILYLICFLFSGYIQAQNEAIPAFESLIDYPNVRDLTLSKNGNEAYLTVQSPLEEVSTIVKIEKTDTDWSEPKIVSFSGMFKDIEPFLSPDNLRLYFASNRPLKDVDSIPKDFDIWYVERTSLTSDWGKAINLGAPINTSNNEFYPSLAENGNLYYTSDAMAFLRKDEIYFSEWKNKKYNAPTLLADSINSKGFEFNAFVAPDESFLIFTGYNREGGIGSGDLYISYRNKKGEWSSAKNLGIKVNSSAMDYCPYYDKASETLYFTSKRSNYKAVNDFRDLEDLKSEISKYDNGLSRIYKIKIAL